MYQGLLFSETAGKNPNIVEAVKAVSQEYRQKHDHMTVDDFADLIGMSGGTFSNKLKPSNMTNYFTGDEIMKITKLTGDFRILDAMDHEVGRVAYDPIEAMPDGGDVMADLLMGVLGLDIHKGHLSQLVKDACEDSTIDEKEARDIEKVLKLIRKVGGKLEMMLELHRRDIE